MIIDSKIFHYPLIIIVLIITYQISVYLFYRYYHIRSENLGINKFLIAFGFLYSFGFTGIIIRTINSYYVENSLIYNFLIDFSHLFIFIAALSFLIIVSQKCFHELINTFITKFVCIITIILSILILIIKDVVINGILVLISLFIGVVFMLIFHFRLIQKSTGKVKYRIILLFIGEIIISMAIAIGTEKNPYLFSFEQQQIVKLIFPPLIILGQILIFYAFYDVPIFLEFKWKENLIRFYIIDRNRLKIIYDYNFKKDSVISQKLSKNAQNISKNDTLFSKGIIGIEKIYSTIIKSKNSKIEKIKHGNNIILLSYDDSLPFITYCLLVKEEMNTIHYFLKIIKNKFKEFYEPILLNLDSIENKEKQLYLNFNSEIEKFLVQY